MNKRIKKKKAKQKELQIWRDTYPLPKPERYGLDFNDEGYRDKTAAQAIRNVMNERRNPK